MFLVSWSWSGLWTWSTSASRLPAPVSVVAPGPAPGPAPAPAPVPPPVSGGGPRPPSSAVVSSPGGVAIVLGHLHSHLAALEHPPVQPVHGVLGVTPADKHIFCLLRVKWSIKLPVVISDESKAPVVLTVLVSGNVDVSDLAVLLEYVLEVPGRGPGGNTVHFEAHHSALENKCLIREECNVNSVSADYILFYQVCHLFIIIKIVFWLKKSDIWTGKNCFVVDQGRSKKINVFRLTFPCHPEFCRIWTSLVVNLFWNVHKMR